MKKGVLLLPLCVILNGYAADEREINIAEIVVGHPNDYGRGLSSQTKSTPLETASVSSQILTEISNPNNYNFTEGGIKLAKKVHGNKKRAEKKVNVHIERTPVRTILKRAGEGLAYGVAAGCIMGLLYYTYTQPKSIRDTAYVASVGSVGFGLAGATWYGTRQAAKEFNKRNLLKTRTVTLNNKVKKNKVKKKEAL